MGQAHLGHAEHVGHWGRIERPVYPGHPYRDAGSEGAGPAVRAVADGAEPGRPPLLGRSRPVLRGPVSRPAARSIPLQRAPEPAASAVAAGVPEPTGTDGFTRPVPQDAGQPHPEQAVAPRPIAVAPTPGSWHPAHGRTLSASEPFRWLREYPPGMFDWLFRRGRRPRG